MRRGCSDLLVESRPAGDGRVVRVEQQGGPSSWALQVDRGAACAVVDC